MRLVLAKYFGCWIRNLVGLKHNALRSVLPLQLEHILIQESCKDKLDLVTGVPPSRTSVSATSKLHLRVRDGCKLVFFLVTWSRLSKVVEAQAVESLWVWIYARIKIYCVRGRKGYSACWYVAPIWKCYRSQCFSLESSWWMLVLAKRPSLFH